jgi:phenylpropionate dioxygenase-like ring-hydroxylating dioxygenase large terminal subunit
MLSREDNELLVRIGPDTPMGKMIRRYWFPALLSAELPEPDGKPVRVRLLGEDLVAFRDTSGKVGLLEEKCPHRRASLALGVNDKNGLRCLYHGWKFATDGRCLERPTEPGGAGSGGNIRAVAYATHEAGRVIWAYMGPADEKPEFPDLDWLGMPAPKSVPFKIMEDCNYAQAVEGTIDTAHAGVLHRQQPWDAPARFDHERDLTPKLEVEFTGYGMRYAGLRRLPDGRQHVRITQVLLPFTTLIPPAGEGPPQIKNRRLTNAFVPRDDETTWHFQWFFDETREIDVTHRIEEGGIWLDDNFRKKVNIDNWYNQDREWMKSGMMSGIKGVVTQDHAVCETQGRILDRTKEHLGTSDVAVVAWRRMMIRAARALMEKGEAPPGTQGGISWKAIRAETIKLAEKASWKQEVPGVNVA